MDLLLIERAKTASELVHAAACFRQVEALLPTCQNDEERARVQFAVDNFKEEVRLLGERMLQLAASNNESVYPSAIKN